MKNRVLWMAGAAAVAVAATAQDRRPPPPEPGLYFFFAPDTPRLAETARIARQSGARLRPVLLATDLRNLPETLEGAVAELGPLSLVDEEGLDLARRWGIAKTPAFAHVDRRGRVHVAYGTKVDSKEVLSCSR